MPSHIHPEDRHEAFILRVWPDGTTDLSVCWDQTEVREIAKKLRQIAAALDVMPADTNGIGVQPL